VKYESTPAPPSPSPNNLNPTDGPIINTQQGARQGIHGKMVVNGQLVDAHQVYFGTRDERESDGRLLGWCKLKPLRQYPHNSQVVADVQSQLPAGHPYEGDNPFTTVHEGTHGIASRVREHLLPAGWNAFYVLDNQVFVCRTPKVRLSQVQQYVPQQLRLDGWGLYMNKQDWEHNALYILDEWIAYINGSRAAREYQRRGNTGNIVVDKDYDKCVEFAGYASALLRAIQELDPTYPDLDRLRDFIGFNLQRTLNVVTPNQGRLVENLRSVYGTTAMTNDFMKPHGYVFVNNRWQRDITKLTKVEWPGITVAAAQQPKGPSIEERVAKIEKFMVHVEELLAKQ
jgi:hypothetical protein